MQDNNKKYFENLAQKNKSHGLIGELFSMLSENKKWWLIPILLVLLLFGLLIIVGGSTYAPFIYTIF